jgi:hypothetical protein
MAVTVAAIGAGIGLAAQGINMYMSYRDKRRAERALAAMGPRKKLEVPKEIMQSYQERLRRSKMYQGYSQAELNQMRSAQSRQNATMFNRLSGLGSSPMAIQALAANTDARNWSTVAAQNAAMNRQGKLADLNAADQLAGITGRYGFLSQQDVLGNYDLTAERYGRAKATQDENIGNMIAGIGQFGATAGVSPELWDKNLFG